MGQRVLVAHGAAWRAGLCRIIVSILVVRGVGLRRMRLLLGVAGLARGRRGMAFWSQWSSVGSLGILFQVPAGGRPIDGPLVDDAIRIVPVRKADGLGSQRVIGYWLLLRRLSTSMPSDLFFESGHRYTSSSCASERGPVTCWLSCCAHPSGLCCLASMYSRTPCCSKARRRPSSHWPSASKHRIIWRLTGPFGREHWLPRRSHLR